jgi:hypothetical protein
MPTSKTSKRMIALFSVVMTLLGCQERRPSTNTPAYSAAHGVVAGQPAHLKVGGEMFHIPADVMMQMETSGEIIKGQADYLYLFFNRFTPQPTETASIPGPSYGEQRLRIEIRHSLGNLEGEVDHTRPWISIKEIPEWQLREYRESKSGRGGWGEYSYEGLAGTAQTPNDKAVHFSCTGTYPNHAECWGDYRFNSEIQIWYFFPTEWLPVWQQVHQHVVSTVKEYHQPIKP